MPDGSKLHQAMACGAFAEKVTVHHSQVVKLPESVPMDSAALIACGVITGIGAVVNAANARKRMAKCPERWKLLEVPAQWRLPMSTRQR